MGWLADTDWGAMRDEVGVGGGGRDDDDAKARRCFDGGGTFAMLNLRFELRVCAAQGCIATYLDVDEVGLAVACG